MLWVRGKRHFFLWLPLVIAVGCGGAEESSEITNNLLQQQGVWYQVSLVEGVEQGDVEEIAVSTQENVIALPIAAGKVVYGVLPLTSHGESELSGVLAMPAGISASLNYTLQIQVGDAFPILDKGQLTPTLPTQPFVVNVAEYIAEGETTLLIVSMQRLSTVLDGTPTVAATLSDLSYH